MIEDVICTDARNNSFHSKRDRISVASIDGVDNCGIGDFGPHFNLGIGVGVR